MISVMIVPEMRMIMLARVFVCGCACCGIGCYDYECVAVCVCVDVDFNGYVASIFVPLAPRVIRMMLVLYLDSMLSC